MSYKALAKTILEDVGGRENVAALTHCMSRLRFELIDRECTNSLHLKDVRGVRGVLYSGGQYMVVIGKGIESVYREIRDMLDTENEPVIPTKPKERRRGGVLRAFVYLLAFTGIASAAWRLTDIWGLADTNNNLYKSFEALADCAFYLLPILLVGAADRRALTETVADKEIVYAPVKGKVVDIPGEIKNALSGSEYSGGAAIIPETNLVVSPISGEITSVSKGYNSFELKSNSGTEIMVYIGINTSELGGKFFKSFAEEGSRVRVGDPLIEFEKNALEIKGYDLTTSVVVSKSCGWGAVKIITDFATEQKPFFEITMV